MNYYENNLSYKNYAASLGLEVVGSFDLADQDYSFALVKVWRDVENPADFYLGTDSGCSCPMPFENYHTRDDLTGPLTLSQVLEECRSLAETSYERDYALAEFADFSKELH